jgi:hypothetical protein
LPNKRKISARLDRFPGKLALHPGVGATKLTISKFLRNPPSSCAAHLLLNNLIIVDLEILWHPLSSQNVLDSGGSQQSKERIITGVLTGIFFEICLLRSVDLDGLGLDD